MSEFPSEFSTTGSSSANTSMIDPSISITSITAEQYFHAIDGQSLRSIEELLVFLRTCNDQSFMHHVTATRNDFANWVRDVFHQTQLADQLASTLDRNKIIVLLESFVLHPESVLARGTQPSPPLNDISAIHTYTDTELQKFSKFNAKAEKPDVDSRIEQLTAKLKELNAQIHALRKNGKNPIIPDLLARTIKPKIDYFKITGDQSDYEKVLHTFDELAREIEFCSHETSVDVRAEIAGRIRG